jgi:hypothetical protein
VEKFNNFQEDLQKVFDTIADELHNEYSHENLKYAHKSIAYVFKKTAGFGYSIESIISRLMIIETYYSTNASYCYFSFEEMAKAIYNLGCECKAKQYFANLVTMCIDSNEEKVFQYQYGCHKNLRKGSQQLSLLSKYAYYQLFQNKHYPLGFPIYDKLAHKIYPKLCSLLEIIPKTNIEESIQNHNSAFNAVRTKIWKDYNNSYKGIQQFDLLDAYLWRMGKFSEGSLFNLMSYDDYKKFIMNLGLEYKDETEAKYKERIYDTFDMSIKNPQIIRKDHVKNKRKEKYTIDFDKLILYFIKHPPKGINPFEGLKQQKYLEKLYEHWLLYYSNVKTRKLLTK